MTNTSHQPDSMTQDLSEQLDVIINRREFATFAFMPGENGCMEETHDSLKRRITSVWGFQTSGIVLMEGSMMQHFEVGGVQFNVYDHVAFAVNGKGWSTDFERIERDDAYDDEES